MAGHMFETPAIEQWVKWQTKDTILYVYNTLQGPAQHWLESLKHFNIND